jgi:DNA-binding beta-propeller fold protein YncE
MKRSLQMITMTIVAIALTVAGCGDDDNGSDNFGRVDGTVYLPSTLSASLQPAEGVTVRLSGGDFLETLTTGADGRFGFDDVPARSMTLALTPGTCLADTQMTVTVVKNDTLTRDVTLRVDAGGDCIPLPYAGAARMEIDGASNRGVLLYDTAVRAKPALVVIDLATGAVGAVEFADLANVYDLAFVTGDVVVFNCFKTGEGYYLRFWNISTMTAHRGDIYYTSDPVQVGGHLAVAPGGGDVFVSHQTRPGLFSFDGQVYCLNVESGDFTDADNWELDGRFGFDSSLVGASVNWPYGLAIDPTTSELLVANYNDTVIVAIDLNYWGTFDRTANPTAPIPGVRKIAMSTGQAGYRPLLWAFGGDRGVAASPSFGMLGYQSGASSFSGLLVEPSLTLTSGSHHLVIDDTRGTWYTLVSDPARPQSTRESVEERSLTTLAKIRHFGTRFIETPALDPRAFAVNPQTGRLYVGYTNKAILEIFPLD